MGVLPSASTEVGLRERDRVSVPRAAVEQGLRLRVRVRPQPEALGALAVGGRLDEMRQDPRSAPVVIAKFTH